MQVKGYTTEYRPRWRLRSMCMLLDIKLVYRYLNGYGRRWYVINNKSQAYMNSNGRYEYYDNAYGAFDAYVTDQGKGGGFV